MRNYPPTPTDKIKKKKKKIIFPTMAAADGSLGRSSEEKQVTEVVEAEVVAAVRRGPLQIRKILELHGIIKYIYFPILTCLLLHRVGFNENKRRASLKVMEKTK